MATASLVKWAELKVEIDETGVSVYMAGFRIAGPVQAPWVKDVLRNDSWRSQSVTMRCREDNLQDAFMLADKKRQERRGDR